MATYFNSPNWMYLREVSSTIDRFAVFIERSWPKLAMFAWRVKHNINDLNLKRREFRMSPEKLGQNLPMAFLIIYLGLVGVAVVAINWESKSGTRLVSLTTGSMAPEIKPGTAVIIEKQKNYSENDIVTYQEINPSSGNKLPSTVTHRIVREIKTTDGDLYITKGDANKIPDPVTVQKKQIMGKVVKKIPYLGYFIEYLQTLPGFLALIVFPAGLLIYNELKFIKNQLFGKNDISQGVDSVVEF